MPSSSQTHKGVRSYEGVRTHKGVRTYKGEGEQEVVIVDRGGNVMTGEERVVVVQLLQYALPARHVTCLPVNQSRSLPVTLTAPTLSPSAGPGPRASCAALRRCEAVEDAAQAQAPYRLGVGGL